MHWYIQDASTFSLPQMSGFRCGNEGAQFFPYQALQFLFSLLAR